MSSNGGATISECGKYRYDLWRTWNESGRSVLFVCLNPSTADATNDDPTIRRCMGFARAWGYGKMDVANLFAYRATNPSELLRVSDPIGACNDDWLYHLMGESSMVVAAWGNRGGLLNRADEFMCMIPLLTKVHCLGVNKSGQPKHPLYLPKDAALQLYTSQPSSNEDAE